MRSANLDPTCNLWYELFDFNDEDKTGDNWRILAKEEEAASWFPLGACEPAIPRTEPGSVIKQSDGDMQTFNIHTGMEAAATAVEEAASSPVKVESAAASPRKQPHQQQPQEVQQQEIGSAHVCTPAPNKQLVSRLLLDK